MASSPETITAHIIQVNGVALESNSRLEEEEEEDWTLQRSLRVNSEMSQVNFPSPVKVFKHPRPQPLIIH